MAMPSLIELAEAGAHYGHHRSLTYPKAKNFIYMVKNNVSLINLEETLNCLEEAQVVLHENISANRPVLFVGTKRSIRHIVKEAAESINAPYIVERWYGGFLTNFQNFATQLKRMDELTKHTETEKFAKLEKKERARIQNRLDHYNRFLGGAVGLHKLPELLVVGSATEDKIAIGEARKLGIPVIAIIDTDINPDQIDYPIPANDDAPRAIELIMKALVEQPTKKSPKVAKEEPTVEEPAVEAEETAKATKPKTVKKVTEKVKVVKKPAAKKATAKKSVK